MKRYKKTDWENVIVYYIRMCGSLDIVVSKYAQENNYHDIILLVVIYQRYKIMREI